MTGAKKLDRCRDFRHANQREWLRRAIDLYSTDQPCIASPPGLDARGARIACRFFWVAEAWVTEDRNRAMLFGPLDPRGFRLEIVGNVERTAPDSAAGWRAMTALYQQTWLRQHWGEAPA